MSGLGFAAIQTPVSDTGSNLQESVAAEIGWLTVTHQSVSIGELLRLMEWLEVPASDSFVLQDTGVTRGIFYQTWFKSVRGAEIVCGDMTKETFAARFNMSASWIAAVGMRFFVCEVLPALVSQGWKATRLDLSVDDFEKLLHPDFVYQECKAGKLVRFRDYTYMENAKGGKTCYIGSTQSDTRMRVYDKSIESNGDKDCVRWEAQFRNEKANSVMNALVNREKNFANTVIDIVTGTIEFREQDDSNATRRTPCGWWLAFVEHLKAVPKKIPSVRVKPSLQRTVNWMFRQVETSLALIAECSTNPGFEQFLSSMLKSGKSRLNSTHRAIIDLHKKHVESMPFLLASIPH